jgi:hypothetical protein
MSLLKGEYSLDSGTFRVMLVRAYSHDPLHIYITQVRSYEASGTGYTAGGILIPTYHGTVLPDPFTGIEPIQWISPYPVWPGLDAGEFSHAIVYHDGGTDGTRKLMFSIEIGSAYPSSGGSYTLQWDENSGSEIILELSEEAA